jgi:hypothetical protein
MVVFCVVAATQLGPASSPRNLCLRRLPRPCRGVGVYPERSRRALDFSSSWFTLDLQLSTFDRPSLVFPPNSHRIISFADPHLLTLLESYRFKKYGGRGHSISAGARHSHLTTNSFRCNTYATPRMCGKQRTYRNAKPFTCHTYKKQGGGAPAKAENRKKSNGCCSRRRGHKAEVTSPALH